jgi:hypothetical protein
MRRSGVRSSCGPPSLRIRKQNTPSWPPPLPGIHFRLRQTMMSAASLGIGSSGDTDDCAEQSSSTVADHFRPEMAPQLGELLHARAPSFPNRDRTHSRIHREPNGSRVRTPVVGFGRPYRSGSANVASGIQRTATDRNSARFALGSPLPTTTIDTRHRLRSGILRCRCKPFRPSLCRDRLTGPDAVSGHRLRLRGVHARARLPRAAAHTCADAIHCVAAGRQIRSDHRGVGLF